MTQAKFALVADSQADFAYGTPANDAAGLRLSLSIFADRAHLRDQMRDDASAAGFRIAEAADVASLLDGPHSPDDRARPLGEVVLVDCPVVDGRILAGLVRLDMRAAHAGAALVVSTSVDALDDVFGCLSESFPQILVDASRAERLVALGQVLARIPGRRVRELSDEDRMVLLRLTEQISQIAGKLENVGERSPRAMSDFGNNANSSAFRLESPRNGYALEPKDFSDRLVKRANPSLPAAALIRKIIRQRQLRARFFEGELFADPAWDMLLDLTAARAEHGRVSVTSLCIASGVPPTTALRWIGQMTDAGLLQRVEDETDRRRAFITMTDKAADAMTRYFAELGPDAARMV